MSSGLANWLTSSSQLFFGLPTLLLVFVSMLRPRFLFFCFVFCPSCCRARCNSQCQFPLHLILLEMLAALILSSASLLLLLMFSIQTNLLLRLQPSPCHHLGHLGKIRCCLACILYSCCFFRQSLLSYSVGSFNRLSFLCPHFLLLIFLLYLRFVWTRSRSNFHLLPILFRSLILCRRFFPFSWSCIFALFER